MNNIQQTRIQLEKTYQAMGGAELEEDAASILNKQQSQLNGVLDHLAAIFGERYGTHTWNRDGIQSNLWVHPPYGKDEMLIFNQFFLQKAPLLDFF